MMMLVRTWRDDVSPKTLVSERDLDAIEEVVSNATLTDQRHLVEFQAENGNSLPIAIGGTETVVIFGCPKSDPPYCTLRGPAATLEPVFECHSGSVQIEVPRRFVVTFEQGIRDLKAFAITGKQPDGCLWNET